MAHVDPHYENKRAFLSALIELPSMRRALAKVNWTHQNLNYHRASDPLFSRAVEQAERVGMRALEDAAVERAVLGVQEDVYFKDEYVQTKTVYSDKLLELVLKGNYRKYREGEDASSGAAVNFMELAQSAGKPNQPPPEQRDGADLKLLLPDTDISAKAAEQAPEPPGPRTVARSEPIT